MISIYTATIISFACSVITAALAGKVLVDRNDNRWKAKCRKYLQELDDEYEAGSRHGAYERGTQDGLATAELIFSRNFGIESDG